MVGLTKQGELEWVGSEEQGRKEEGRKAEGSEEEERELGWLDWRVVAAE